MDGPREVRSEDLGSLRALTDLVMREGLVDQFPQLFSPDNFGNLRICAENGKVVSHVGMTQRDAVLLGCPIRAALIGGVCTHPDYRRRGLASACFDDAFRKARADGVDMMIVSGDRNLYRMRGCVPVGSGLEFEIARDTVPAALAERSAAVTVEVMTDDELPLVEECYRAEPVRFERPHDDYRFALESGWVMNRPSDFLVIREGGAFRGYIIAPRRGKESRERLAEFAGDRGAALAAIPHVLNRYDLSSVAFHVMRRDERMRILCEQYGLQGSPRSTPGTVTLVNFPQFMERMRPHFAERLDPGTASNLQFRDIEDRPVFALGKDEYSTDRAEAARLIFGTSETPSSGDNELPGALRDAFPILFPLPTLWYGINYV